MTNSEQLRIGPPRDRRRGKRIVTPTNFLIALLVSVLAFAAISIRSEMRPEKPGDFGRLYSSRTIPAAKPVPEPIVIPEQEIPDQTGADPMLVQNGSREQYLGVVSPVTPSNAVTNVGTPSAVTPSNAMTNVPDVAASSTSFAAPEQPVVNSVSHNERIVLTGGPDGLRLDVKKVR